MENTEAEKSEKNHYRKHRKHDLVRKRKNNITWKIQKQIILRVNVTENQTYKVMKE